MNSEIKYTVLYSDDASDRHQENSKLHIYDGDVFEKELHILDLGSVKSSNLLSSMCNDVEHKLNKGMHLEMGMVAFIEYILL